MSRRFEARESFFSSDRGLEGSEALMGVTRVGQRGYEFSSSARGLEGSGALMEVTRVGPARGLEGGEDMMEVTSVGQSGYEVFSCARGLEGSEALMEVTRVGESLYVRPWGAAAMEFVATEEDEDLVGSHEPKEMAYEDSGSQQAPVDVDDVWSPHRSEEEDWMLQLDLEELIHEAKVVRDAGEHSGAKESLFMLSDIDEAPQPQSAEKIPIVEAPQPQNEQDSFLQWQSPVLQWQSLFSSEDEQEAPQNEEIREKLHLLLVKLVRISRRLGQTPNADLFALVLHMLGQETKVPSVFGVNRASIMAEQLKVDDEQWPLNFSCTIMVMGKTGVGKSATINSIFDEPKVRTNAYNICTIKVQEIVGMVQGIKVRAIDTPGLLSSRSDWQRNVRVLSSVKRFIRSTPPDIIFYIDRLDMQCRDKAADLEVLECITKILGPSIWHKSVIVLTHAAAPPPDGPNKKPLDDKMERALKCRMLQRAICQATGNSQLKNIFTFVENDKSLRQNRSDQDWERQLLFLSVASKVSAEAIMLLNRPTDTSFAFSALLPFLLSSLLQSKENTVGDGDGLQNTSNCRKGKDYSSHSGPSSSPCLVRPVMETQISGHELGYEGLNFEKLIMVKDWVSVSLSGELRKDKKDCTYQMELANLIKHDEEKVTSFGVDIQSFGEKMIYKLRGDTSFTPFKQSKTTIGASAVVLGNSLATGIKIDNKVVVEEKLRLHMRAGAITSQGDVAYKGCIEATWRDKRFPIQQILSAFALSVVQWQGKLSIGCGIHSEFPLGRTNVIGHANVTSRRTGQVGFRLKSPDQLQVSLIAIISICHYFLKRLSSERCAGMDMEESDLSYHWPEDDW